MKQKKQKQAALTPEELAAIEQAAHNSRVEEGESLAIAHSVIESIVTQGGVHLYDKYLEEIKPEFELGVSQDIVYRLAQTAANRPDPGESSERLHKVWMADMEDEPLPPMQCNWQNGNLEVDRRVVFSSKCSVNLQEEITIHSTRPFSVKDLSQQARSGEGRDRDTCISSRRMI